MENSLSKSVKSLCKKQGITMKELAERMLVAPESLSRAINGNPQLSTIMKIAECLKVEVADLFSPAQNCAGIMSLEEFKPQNSLLDYLPKMSDSEETNPPKILNNELVAMVRFRNQTLATCDLATLAEFINTIVRIKQKDEDIEIVQ